MRSAERKVIVIGSGIGGLTAAVALARCGRRVLLLEQHDQPGGLTQTFSRQGYTFATGVHYIGGVGDAPGPQNRFGRLLAWLTDGQLKFASIGSPYDLIRLPGLELPVEAPLPRFIATLKQHFPADTQAIDRYFRACKEAADAAISLFAARAAPVPVARLLGWWNAHRVRRALATTTAGAVHDIGDARLRALLCARWGDYALPPDSAPFAAHALVIGSYFDGAYYPVGGPARFAETFGEAIRSHGGDIRMRAGVQQILIENGRVAGVQLADGERIEAAVVISAMGAHNTAAALPQGTARAWREQLATLGSGLGCVSVYIGLRGDIRAHGASAANFWIHESDDVGAVWEQPTEADAPSLFVSFPSLKDPAHDDPERHTAEVLALCRWQPFAAWADSRLGDRPEAYEATKAWIGAHLMAQFKRHFPGLAPMVEFHEVSTPLTQAAYVGAERGAMYGLDLTAARLQDPALRVRTPVPGLLLAGQDVTSPGIQGACMGGFMAAASLEPRLWRRLR
jgi:all-trans-retinol 13,14-reductase